MKRFVLAIQITLHCFLLIDESLGHGMLLDPAGRSSRWRFNNSARANYDDMGLFCGGFNVQYSINGGKCGFCGDDYRNSAPRPNELGGLYGEGVIVQTFKSSSKANIKFEITANHLGYVYLELCNLDKFGKESEECFTANRLKFEDGTEKLSVGSKIGPFKAVVVLPNGLECVHCVMRWTYYTGNNWGVCDNGQGELGCGSQETFKSCADIAIKADSNETPEMPETPE